MKVSPISILSHSHSMPFIVDNEKIKKNKHQHRKEQVEEEEKEKEWNSF